MITVKTQFNEKLQWIVEPESLDEQLFRARTVAQMDPTFPQLIRMASVDAERISGLPSGIPDTLKLEKDIPSGIANTTIRQEFRRIKNFLPNTDVQRMSAIKREQLWIQILEGVHHKEAECLTQIKDRTLFYAYPNLFDIMENLGATIDIPRVAPVEDDVDPKEEVVTFSEESLIVSSNTEESVMMEPEPKKKGRKPKILG